MIISKKESRVLLAQIFYSKEQGMDDDWMEGYLIEQIERLSKLRQVAVIKNEVAVCCSCKMDLEKDEAKYCRPCYENW